MIVDLLGKTAIAKTGPGNLYGIGKVIAYCDSPQVCIERKDGTKFWWVAALCEFNQSNQSAQQGAAVEYLPGNLNNQDRPDTSGYDISHRFGPQSGQQP